MPVLAKSPMATQQILPPQSSTPAQSYPGSKHKLYSPLCLQNTIGNQAVRRLFASNTGETKEGAKTFEFPGFVPYFNRSALSVNPSTMIQPKRRAEGALRVEPPPSGEPGEITDQPAGGGTPPVVPTPPVGDSCGQPTGMHKLTSGSFLGGLTMDSYYPHLRGRGVYAHPGTAGPFDINGCAGAISNSTE